MNIGRQVKYFKKSIMLALMLTEILFFRIGQAENPSAGDALGNWSLNVDWLYWKTRRGGLDYCVKDAVFPVVLFGNLETVYMNYRHGFQIECLKDIADCNKEFGVRFTFLGSKNKAQTIRGQANIVPTRMHPFVGGSTVKRGFIVQALSVFQHDYNNLLFESLHIMNDDVCCGVVKAMLGLNIVWDRQTLSTIYADGYNLKIAEIERVRETQKMMGGGALAGLDGVYDCGIFDLHTHLGCGLLVCKVKTERQQYNLIHNVIRNIAQTSHVDSWESIPTVEARIGVRADLSYCFCESWQLEAGYGLTGYYGMPDFIQEITPPGATGLVVIKNKINVGFDGFYLRVTIIT